MEEIIEKKKILIAANWKNKLEDEFGDPNYAAFVKVMTYRREIAKNYLFTKNEEDKKNILILLNDCNDKLHQILGL